ncbi:MAG: hypothetical protein ABJA98_12145 [Acidobacteriota bacterium]
MVTITRRAATRIALVAALIGSAVPVRESRAQAPNTASPLVGAWRLNKELSDSPQDGASDDREGGSTRGANRGGGGGGGRRRGGGGFGGGFGGGGGGRGGGGQGVPAADPQETARLRDAMRDILNPPDRLTIVQTESMVIITGPDGRTTRLSPDGKKIKDDSTKIERRTKWDGGKLISEIGGLPLGKITETWAVDSERRQLHISLRNDDDRRPLMVTRVYDADVH